MFHQKGSKNYKKLWSVQEDQEDWRFCLESEHCLAINQGMLKTSSSINFLKHAEKSTKYFSSFDFVTKSNPITKATY
jgi:hypothetical protein